MPYYTLVGIIARLLLIHDPLTFSPVFLYLYIALFPPLRIKYTHIIHVKRRYLFSQGVGYTHTHIYICVRGKWTHTDTHTIQGTPFFTVFDHKLIAVVSFVDVSREAALTNGTSAFTATCSYVCVFIDHRL